jgi:hypothetical protein
MPMCEPIQIGCIVLVKYNDHNPHEYVEKLHEMDDEKLYDACKETIWLSAYAHNNPRSDFHWMCDACYDECRRRGKADQIYKKAYDVVSRS